MTPPNWTHLQTLTTIDQLADAAHENAKAKGFHDDGLNDQQFLERHTNLLHEEVSELFSATRTGMVHLPCDKAVKMADLGLPQLTCAEEEYADIVIRVFDQCRRLGIDIQRAIQAKHGYNTTRERLHGKKF
jgi:NTP pyrophosphatase (non-canonical NTP hydrolase)